MYLMDFTSERDGFRAFADYAIQTLGHDAPIKSLINGVSHVVGQAKPDWLPRRNDDGGRAVARAARRTVELTDEP